MNVLLDSHYAPCLAYMALLANADTVVIDGHAHYRKGSYRNRCYIYGANGRLRLSIPLRHGRQEGRQAMHDVLIAYDHPWQEQHWESLCSAYRSSPYFEFFEDDIRPLYRERTDGLMDFNTRLLAVICGLTGIAFEPEFTDSYRESWPGLEDLRERIRPDFSKEGPGGGMEPYTQVFDQKHGFLPNLSVFDLLFNTGPHLAGHLPGGVQLPA